MNKKIFIILLTTLFLFISIVQAQTNELPNPRLLPDSPFYFLKSWTERIGTFFTFGTEAKVKRFLTLSERRLTEAIILNERGKTELAEKTLEEYQNNFESAMGDLEKSAHSENFIASLLDPIINYAVRTFQRVESVSISDSFFESLIDNVFDDAISGLDDLEHSSSDDLYEANMLSDTISVIDTSNTSDSSDPVENIDIGQGIAENVIRNLERLIAVNIEIKKGVYVGLSNRWEKRPEIILEEQEESDSSAGQELEKDRPETEKAKAEAEPKEEEAFTEKEPEEPEKTRIKTEADPEPDPEPDPVNDKIDASWPDKSGYIYNKGKYAEMWVEGRNSGHSGNEISKQADYLWLKADAKDGAAITWVTSEKIDMSKWNSLLFIYKWEHSNRLQSPDGPEYSRFDPWIDISDYNEKAYVEFTVLNPSTRSLDPTTSALQIRIGTHNEIRYDGDRGKLFGTDTLAGLEIYSVWLE